VAGTLTVKNSIIYNDTTYLQIATTVTIANSAIRGSLLTGNTSLSWSAYSKRKDSIAVAPVDTFSYYLSPTSTLRNAGTNSVTLPSTDINGNVRLYDLTVDIGAVEYSEIYIGSNTWETAGDWNIGRIPHNKDIVTTSTACHVTSTTAVCKKLIIGSGSLTINPNTQLIVSDSIRNKDATKLIVKTDSVTGTLIFHNASGNSPYATVEMYSKASWNKSLPTNSIYNWQYFGVPVQPITASPTFDGAYVRKWDETGDSITNHWVQQTNASVLMPFTGYEICQPSATTYPIQGQLVNSNFTTYSTTVLPYTISALYPGQHIFANPYTAAIYINKLTFGTGGTDGTGGTEATVYLYNTGTYAQWQNDSIHATPIGTSAGQYTAVPQKLSGGLSIPTIPSMQGFLVKAMANNSGIALANANFSITYASVVTQNTSALRAPKTKEADSTDYVYTRIDVSGTRFSDRMWIFTIPGCTQSFNNGWDGHKLMGSALTPQLFAMEADGDYQVKSVNDMSNTYLGFQPGEDTDYTLTFKNKNLNKYYSNVYLLDLAENKTVDITSDSTAYRFTTEASGNQSKRFKIVTVPVATDTLSVTNDIKVFGSERTIFVNNHSNLSGNLALYDLSGRLIKTVVFGAGCITPVQTSVSPGVYIVKAGTKTFGLTQRLILQ
jgi:hypothetical protein